jgi:hypothetical protein
VPDTPFNFKEQHDYDLHIALEVDVEILERMFDKGKEDGIHTRGVVNHGFIRSIYFAIPSAMSLNLQHQVKTPPSTP